MDLELLQEFISLRSVNSTQHCPLVENQLLYLAKLAKPAHGELDDLLTINLAADTQFPMIIWKVKNYKTFKRCSFAIFLK